MTQAGRAGVNAVQGTPAAGLLTGGQRAAGRTNASDGKNTGRNMEGGRRHQRDRPSRARGTPRGYRSPTDWTVVYGHASAIPAPPPEAVGAEDNRPQRRI